MSQILVKKRTLRRQQKKLLIAEAQQDIDTVEARIGHTDDAQELKGLNVLLDLLYLHIQELIDSEV